MLIKCPECDLQISDKAISCPHCGYPLAPTVRKKPRGRPRRLPNGFGRITKISNQNLRNPYRAMVTIGKTADGKPVSKILKPKGYFRTYNEAYAALIEYNKNPYDLSSDMTVNELFKKWYAEYSERTKSAGTVRNVTTAWNYCSSVKGIRVADLRIRHIKQCVYDGMHNGHKPPTNIKPRIKCLFNMMLDYAMEYELVDKNYSRMFDLNSEAKENIKHVKQDHLAFTDEELAILWNSLEIPYVDIVLIQCYSGWRPQELGLIELKNVDLENRIMISGMKTAAGKDRRVPIHSKIYPLVAMRYKNAAVLGSKYLINSTDSRSIKETFMSYSKYLSRFHRVMDQLGLNKGHRPHDGRKTFITLAKRYKVDEYAIKYMVGHRINDITEKIYTEREFSWLIEEIEKIK